MLFERVVIGQSDDLGFVFTTSNLKTALFNDVNKFVNKCKQVM